MSPPKRRRTTARPAPERLPALIESLLFVAEEPQEIGALARSLNVPRQGVEKAVEELSGTANGRGLFVQRLGDRLQLATVPDAAPYIEQFLEVEHGRLSRAALEVLAVIAYRQPVTRAAIESVRGVNSDQSVATLVARGLVGEVGRAPGPGRPVLFGTTVRFLEYFGLQRPEEMPPLPAVELDAPPGELETPAEGAIEPPPDGPDEEEVAGVAGPAGELEAPAEGAIETPQDAPDEEEMAGMAGPAGELETPAEGAIEPPPDGPDEEETAGLTEAAGELEAPAQGAIEPPPDSGEAADEPVEGEEIESPGPVAP